MKTQDILLIGGAIVAGYYLAPSEIKEAVNGSLGGGGGSSIIRDTVERITETVGSVGSVGGGGDSGLGGLIGGIDVNLKGLTDRMSGMEKYVKDLTDAIGKAGADLTGAKTPDLDMPDWLKKLLAGGGDHTEPEKPPDAGGSSGILDFILKGGTWAPEYKIAPKITNETTIQGEPVDVWSGQALVKSLIPFGWLAPMSDILDSIVSGKPYHYGKTERDATPLNADDATTLAAGRQATADLAVKTPSNIERPVNPAPVVPIYDYRPTTSGGSGAGTTRGVDWYKSTPEYTERNKATPLPIPYQRTLGGGGGWSPE